MIVIGNDMVSLHDRNNQKSFNKSSRFFANDCVLAFSQLSLVVERALLWAAKESGYKCICKLGFKKAFSPGLFNVHITEKQHHIYEGWVNYKNDRFFVKLKNNTDCIHSIATNTPQVFPQIKSFELQAPRPIVEQFFLKKMQEIYQLNFPLSLNKDSSNIPYISHQGRLPIDISISHEEDKFLFSSLSLSTLYQTN